MMPIHSWRIYYGDGSVYASTDGPWDEAPDDDVQVVMLYHDEEYRTILHGSDTFSIPGQDGKKDGRLMDDELYATLVTRALADPRPATAPSLGQ